MNHSVRHRGPDGEGYYFGDHFAFGHRMLKITDFGITGRQPMAYMDYVILYNGEVYNFKPLKEILKKEGYLFSTSTDTEVILASYDKWGSACVHHFKGMWAFVIYDRKKKLMFCSRDRFGIKPLCYTQFNQKFLIGSEIKQFTEFEDFTLGMNKKAAFDFLYHGKIIGTKDSFFENVHFLPAGHHLIYDLSSHTYSITKWYDINKFPVNKLTDFNEAAATFKELFTQSMLDHLHSKVPIGACLSGGLDSTSITGAARQTNSRITTFSSCYTQHGYNEIEYINQSIEYYDFPSHKNYPSIHELTENNLLGKIVYHQDQPILSGSFFSEYKVFESVSLQNIRILLSGQGADEYLGGYGEFSLLQLLDLARKGKWRRLSQEITQSAAIQNRSPREVFKSFLIFGLSIPLLERLKRKPIVDVLVKECLNKKWISQFPFEQGTNAKLFTCRSLSELSREALLRYSLPHQLHSEDRNAMLHSIETRLPFLDHQLVEWCLSLPDNFIIRNGRTKAVLREGLKSILPLQIYNRHAKLGFPGPEESLFIHNYDFVQEQYRNYINAFPDIFSPQLLKTHQAYYNNNISYNPILFRALAFGAWAKAFNFFEPDNLSRMKMPASTTVSVPY